MHSNAATNTLILAIKTVSLLTSLLYRVFKWNKKICYKRLKSMCFLNSYITMVNIDN